MRTFILILLMFFSLPMFGGEIYVSKTKNDARLYVYVTTIKVDAHLFVYKSNSAFYSKHRDDWWYFTDTDLPSVVHVYFVNTKGDADVVIYYTPNSWESGWKKHNLFQGRFKR